MDSSKFEDELLKKQLELEMTTSEFANYIGVHRTWLINLRNPNLPKHKLSKKTIGKLHNRCNISIDILNDYNNKIIGDNNGR